MNYLYLLLNIGTIAIPLLFSFHPRFSFAKTWHAFWPACLITAAFFIAWDVVFTDWGVWGFNPRYLIGIDILNLPLEEWLFFICIPYACVFTYFCLKELVKRNPFASFDTGLTLFLIVVLAGLALANAGKWYTGVTFGLTAFFLFALLGWVKPGYMPQFYLAYLAIFLFPFLLVNGTLTGSFIEQEVVWYNNEKNLGIRIFTIPIEDFIYGMLLYLMNVSLYEWFLGRRNR